MTVANYNQILTDMQLLIQTISSIEDVTVEESDVAFPALSKMCKANIRLVASPMEVRVGQDYFSDVNLEIDVLAVDLSSYAEAANMRNGIVRDVVTTIRDNARSFSSDVESTITTNVAFEGGPVEDQGFVAIATVEVSVKVYENR